MMAREEWCILDCETTSLSGFLVEIAVIDRQGSTLFHSLVNPECQVSAEAAMVHAISDEELAAAPTLPEIWPALLTALAGKSTIVSYNVDFDRSTLMRDAARYHLDLPKFDWHCLMHNYAQYVGDWQSITAITGGRVYPEVIITRRAMPWPP